MGRTSETAKAQEHVITGLVRRAVKGDVEAYGEVYKLCLYRIYRYVFNQVGNARQAEDITEEVFIKVWKAIKTCQGKEDTFIPWLHRVAHNHMVDTLRKDNKEIPTGNFSSPSGADPEKELEKRQELQEVLEAVNRLPEMQKQVILLKYLDDSDNEEIGRILNKRQGAVRALQMRALNRLREVFNFREGKDGR
jgi:RNA polymerase sigma-70 factor, ECF subfamily